MQEAYVKILAKIVSGMQKHRSFVMGLKVFNLIVQLTEDCDQETFLKSLMRKQSN